MEEETAESEGFVDRLRPRLHAAMQRILARGGARLDCETNTISYPVLDPETNTMKWDDE
jgi:hypothetical protein